VTGTPARSVSGSGSIEYRINRKNLKLRNGPDDDRKHLTLSAYAANRMGRGPNTYFGSDNVMLLKHPWWWRGESAYESSTRADGPAGTSSTGTLYYILFVSAQFTNDIYIYVVYIANKYEQILKLNKRERNFIVEPKLSFPSPPVLLYTYIVH